MFSAFEWTDEELEEPGGTGATFTMLSVSLLTSNVSRNLVRSRNPHPMGVVMFAGYAGPGWVWPRAVRSNS
jgi:hypothetical protein